MFRPPTFANAIFHIVILGGVVYPFSRWGGGLLVPFSGFGGSYPPFKALGVVKPHFGVWRALLCIFHNQLQLLTNGCVVINGKFFYPCGHALCHCAADCN